jgi:hypothetical protein
VGPAVNTTNTILSQHVDSRACCTAGNAAGGRAGRLGDGTSCTMWNRPGGRDHPHSRHRRERSAHRPVSATSIRSRPQSVQDCLASRARCRWTQRQHSSRPMMPTGAPHAACTTSPPASTPSSTPSTTPRNSSCYAYSSKTSASPAGTSRSGCASHSTRHHRTRPTHQTQNANHRHHTRAQCQAKTVCVPLVVTEGDSYRMRHTNPKRGDRLLTRTLYAQESGVSRHCVCRRALVGDECRSSAPSSWRRWHDAS